MHEITHVQSLRSVLSQVSYVVGYGYALNYLRFNTLLDIILNKAYFIL